MVEIRGSWQLGPSASAIGSPKSCSRSEGVGRFYLHERTSRLSSLSSGSGRGHGEKSWSRSGSPLLPFASTLTKRLQIFPLTLDAAAPQFAADRKAACDPCSRTRPTAMRER